jgi:hypothetical protein
MAKQPPDNKTLLLQYAGLGAQLLVLLGLAIFAGLKLDQKFQFSFPVLVWALPLLVLVGMMVKAIRDTSKKNDTKK